MIAVIDYGAGNLFSVKNALDYLGIKSIITSNADDIKNADKIILPGVGAFPAAITKLKNSGLIDVITSEAKVKPFLGICLGMQMLFDESFEFEYTKGLSLINGKVDKILDTGLIIPHMGWNMLVKQNDCPLMNGLSDRPYVYFVHSYQAYCNDENISAYCEYGQKVPALVFNKNIFGAQFHPEKSGETGLKILKNFESLVK